MKYETTINGYLFSNDKSRLQPEVIHHFLATESYWSQNIPMEVVKRAIGNSECFGIYHHNKQVGFARMITDYASLAYLADVFVLKEHRGKGLGKQLIEFILRYGPLQNLRRIMLATLDAHGLYRKFGFTLLGQTEQYLEKRIFDDYPR
jgi:GNAT superfamily N-acetyltransferase